MYQRKLDQQETQKQRVKMSGIGFIDSCKDYFLNTRRLVCILDKSQGFIRLFAKIFKFVALQFWQF